MMCSLCFSDALSAFNSPLQWQVRLLETHVRQGVSQLRAAKELAAAAERSINDAGGSERPVFACWGVLSHTTPAARVGNCLCVACLQHSAVYVGVCSQLTSSVLNASAYPA